MNFFLSKNTCGRFSFCCERSLEMRLIQCQVKRKKVQKYAGFDVGAHAAQSTHSVCLISVFFVHFVYLLGRFSEVNIGYQPPLYKPTSFINVVFFFCLFLPPCVIYCAMTFYYFLCYCIIFLHTYPYKHVHMLCFF